MSAVPVPPPGAHGGDAAAIARALRVNVGDLLDLSASLNPVAPDVSGVVARHLDALHRYPDTTVATAAMAEVLGVLPSQLLLTNGGAEAIALVAAEMGVGSVVSPEFSLYEHHLRQVVHDAPRWRSNPSSPLGLLADADEQAGVWDEAFYQLATGTWTRGDVANGAFVVGSLTKLFACPGFRVGYVMSEDEQAMDRLRMAQPRWSVNGLVCEALPSMLAGADLAAWSKAVAALRVQLVGVLTSAGFRCRPGVANWVLVEAPGLREHLIPHGVVIRDCASFGLPGIMRIAVPDAAGLERLEAALVAATAQHVRLSPQRGQ